MDDYGVTFYHGLGSAKKKYWKNMVHCASLTDKSKTVMKQFSLISDILPDDN